MMTCLHVSPSPCTPEPIRAPRPPGETTLPVPKHQLQLRQSELCTSVLPLSEISAVLRRTTNMTASNCLALWPHTLNLARQPQAARTTSFARASSTRCHAGATLEARTMPSRRNEIPSRHLWRCKVSLQAPTVMAYCKLGQ